MEYNSAQTVLQLARLSHQTYSPGNDSYKAVQRVVYIVCTFSNSVIWDDVFWCIGVSVFMECDIGVVGQQGDVEFEVGELGKEISGAGAVCESLERREESVYRDRNSAKCAALWEGQAVVQIQISTLL